MVLGYRVEMLGRSLLYNTMNKLEDQIKDWERLHKLSLEILELDSYFKTKAIYKLISESKLYFNKYHEKFNITTRP